MIGSMMGSWTKLFKMIGLSLLRRSRQGRMQAMLFWRLLFLVSRYIHLTGICMALGALESIVLLEFGEQEIKVSEVPL